MGENVTWTPSLYRWSGSTWYLYSAPPSNHGVAYTTGSTGWVNSGGVNISFYQFSNLPAGSYTVWNSMGWSNGQTAGAWSWYNASSYYCYFT